MDSHDRQRGGIFSGLGKDDRLVLKDWDKREHVMRYAGRIPQGGRMPDDPSYHGR